LFREYSNYSKNKSIFILLHKIQKSFKKHNTKPHSHLPPTKYILSPGAHIGHFERHTPVYSYVLKAIGVTALVAYISS